MYTVKVTLPNHRDEPGKVIAQHVFVTEPTARAFANTVNGHWTGAYQATVHEGDLGAFDTTAGD